MVSNVYRQSEIFQLEVCPAPSATSLATQEDSPPRQNILRGWEWGPSPGEATEHDCRTHHWRTRRTGGQSWCPGVLSWSHNKSPKYFLNIQ